MDDDRIRDVIIVGAGPAGLSAAIYLARALRDVTVFHHGRPMVAWEPHLQNYLGFPNGIDGRELVVRGRTQAERYGAAFVEAEIHDVRREGELLAVRNHDRAWRARRLLIATGTYHRPPDIPGVDACLGRSLFFCKDCDGWRVRGKRIVVIGRNDDAVEYALAMLAYSPRVMIATNGEAVVWDDVHAGWLAEHAIPVHEGRIEAVEHVEADIQALVFEGDRRVAVDVAFTTRGDIYHNHLALSVGCAVDHEGQVEVDHRGRTTVPGVFAAGCLTPANCQVVVAAGQGAVAAQAINRELFEEDLKLGAIKRCRQVQVAREDTLPEILT